mgnify:CR=1 FL=1
MFKSTIAYFLRYFVVIVFTLFAVTIFGLFGTRIVALGIAIASGLTADATLPAIVTYWLLPTMFISGLLFIATFYMIRGVNRFANARLTIYLRNKREDRKRKAAEKKSKKK